MKLQAVPAETAKRGADVDAPKLPYDEMRDVLGGVRPHYQALAERIDTLSAEELAERQKTLERFFLLQGITFTVYGAESSTERIIPTDLLPRIIAAEEWKTIEAGLIQRLKALNMFLADIYSGQQIMMDGVVPRDLVLSAPSYRREMQNLYVPHGAYANVCGSDLIRQEDGRVRGAGGQSAGAVRRLLHAGQPRGVQAGVPRHLPRRGRAADRPLSGPAADDAEVDGGRLAAEPAGRGADAWRLQLRLFRARLPGAADGRAAGRGPRPRGARQHGLHAHDHGPAPHRHHLSPGGRRLHRSPDLPPRFRAWARPACSTPTAPAMW